MLFAVIRRIRMKQLERLIPFGMFDRVEMVFQTESEQAARYYYENLVTETPEWYLITSHLVFFDGEISKD